jgi:UDP-2-acetamido-2,6-beta-L-arabino-hexul-4-ose reductase
VFHLAGVNRPKDEKEFMEGNLGFTAELVSLLKKNGNRSPVLVSSSIQAEKDNLYGISKRAGEELLQSYSREWGVLFISIDCPTYSASGVNPTTIR